MRLFFPLLATLLLATLPLPAESKTAPVRGVAQGTAQVGAGIVRGAGQAGGRCSAGRRHGRPVNGQGCSLHCDVG
jgi:hypothetical protein